MRDWPEASHRLVRERAKARVRVSSRPGLWICFVAGGGAVEDSGMVLCGGGLEVEPEGGGIGAFVGDIGEEIEGVQPVFFSGEVEDAELESSGAAVESVSDEEVVEPDGFGWAGGF